MSPDLKSYRAPGIDRSRADAFILGFALGVLALAAVLAVMEVVG